MFGVSVGRGRAETAMRRKVKERTAVVIYTGNTVIIEGNKRPSDRPVEIEISRGRNDASVAARRRPIITIMVNYKNVVIPRKLHAQPNKPPRAPAARESGFDARKGGGGGGGDVHTRSKKGTEREERGKERRLNEPLLPPSLPPRSPPRSRKIIVNLGGATPFTGPLSPPHSRTRRSRLLGSV